MSFNCPICDNQYPKLISLSLHFRKLHKGTSKKLYTLLYHNGVEPKCGCGCGGEVKYLDMTRGFREFVRGHAARVSGKNNWGNNKKAQEKSQKTRKKMWKEGGLEIWNKGLTKEEHSSVAQYGKKGSETISSNSEELERRSKRMRQGRLDGTVPTLYGPEHSQWNGGTSSLLSTCHSNSHLFKEWKYPLLAKSGFACQSCGRSRNENPRPQLEVHHDNEEMADVVRKIAKKHKWKGPRGLPTESDETIFKLKQTISKEVAEYHIKNKVSGIVLCIDCHKNEHPKHNF